MKIVKWADGTYSVRSSWWKNLGYVYANLSDNDWHSIDSCYFYQCKGTLQQCQKFINKNTIIEVINTKKIQKLRKYTGELKEKLALYAEAKELERKVEELRNKK